MGDNGNGLVAVAPGARVLVRDEEWLVKQVAETTWDGQMIEAVGVSELVRDQEAIFYGRLDEIEVLDPEKTELVPDDSPGFRKGRLYLDALMRRTPLPITETRPAVGHRQLLNDLEFQKRAVAKALNQPRPRILIADAVGLGKTLEIGMILSELIRRGRGERIMVVTPRHILEQFQRELWTRFSIPLVRLDSEGIQRVRRKIPASRNPFTYYKRVIVSIDTLKSTGRYSHHLEDLRWDAVVIDECHNVTNPATDRHRLASLLAPQANALILASATPHNGKKESFAELINMLDPTAIAKKSDYDGADIAHLYVRRFKKDVAAEVSADFPDRVEPKPIMVVATPAENAVIDELDQVWLNPEGSGVASGQGKRLFPWSLLKAFLSSHAALAETVANRRKTIADRVDGGDADAAREDAALATLEKLAAEAGETTPSKLTALVRELDQIGVGKDSDMRVVIFSERIKTLEWLREELGSRLNLPADALELMHGGLNDQEQMAIVEEFGQKQGKIRILLSGDVASEGVNLHRECHQLIHYDLPWSVIRIDQRNGRIDRYGQTKQPEIRALIVSPENERLRGDLRILTRLLAKEHEIHRTIGEAAALMGLHDVKAEEEAVQRRLAEGMTAEQVLPDNPVEGDFDLMAILTSSAEEEEASGVVETADVPALFGNDADFVEEALRQSFENPEKELELRREEGSSLISLKPPPDLQKRLEALPASYLKEQEVLTRLRVTTDQREAEASLVEAQQKEDTAWPRIGWLGSQHPVIEWLTDKVLADQARGTAPVLQGAVTEPVILTQAMFSNTLGQPTVVEWCAISGLGSPDPRVEPMHEALERAGVGPRMTNRGITEGIEQAQDLIPRAVAAAREHIEARRDDAESELNELLDEARARARNWAQLTLELARSETDRRRAEKTRDETEALVRDLRSTGEPLIRIVGAILPEAS